MKTSPLVGDTSPVMHLKREDLPAPFVPRITKQELYCASKEIVLTASLDSLNNPPYTLLTLEAETALLVIECVSVCLLTGISSGDCLILYSSLSLDLDKPRLILTVDNSIMITTESETRIV